MIAAWFLCRLVCARALLVARCNALAKWVDRGRNVSGFGSALDVERGIRLAVLHWRDDASWSPHKAEYRCPPAV